MQTSTSYSLVLPAERPEWAPVGLFVALACYLAASIVNNWPFSGEAALLLIGIVAGHPLFERYVGAYALAHAYPLQTRLNMARMQSRRALFALHLPVLLASNWGVTWTLLQAAVLPPWPAFLLLPLWGHYLTAGMNRIASVSAPWIPEPVDESRTAPPAIHVRLLGTASQQAMPARIAPGTVVLDASAGCWVSQFLTAHPLRELSYQAAHLVVAPDDLLASLHREPEALHEAVKTLSVRYPQAKLIEVWVDARWHPLERWLPVTESIGVTTSFGRSSRE